MTRDEKLRLQLLLEAQAFEAEFARRKEVPDRNRLLHRRLRPLLEYLGAALLALNVATIAMLGNFLVINKILHLSF